MLSVAGTTLKQFVGQDNEYRKMKEKKNSAHFLSAITPKLVRNSVLPQGALKQIDKKKKNMFSTFKFAFLEIAYLA